MTAPMISPKAIEAATKRIYEDKGDRKGIMYVGWDGEPESVKEQWRTDVRVSVEAYLSALAVDGIALVPVEPTPEMLEAGWDAANRDIGGDVIGTIEIQSVIGRSVYRSMLKAAGVSDAGK